MIKKSIIQLDGANNKIQKYYSLQINLKVENNLKLINK